MADDYTANPGSGGLTFAGDDVGAGKIVPRVKAVMGLDGQQQDGWTPHRLVSAASNNATNVKASAGQIGFIWCVNLNAAIRYLKLYNKASAPAPASDNALLVATLPIPASVTGAGFMIPIPAGVNFSTGIGYAMVTGASDTDNTSVAASEIFLWLGYC